VRSITSPRARLPTDAEGKLQAMRLMFGIWVVLLIAGIVFFSVVGLSHR
jgi:hypothetical protein